ncbi:MAG: hypothetical protein MZV70_65200 [Desulfobacterales bacterium]|nr:hypothetical protein [Desulfobacterales bacterium]
MNQEISTETDVLVIGGGGGRPERGHHRAREQGASVLLLECAPTAFPRRQQPPHAQHAPGARDQVRRPTRAPTRKRRCGRTT